MPDRIPAAERAGLIALMRALSPAALPIEAPVPTRALAALIGRDPPRVPRAVLFDVYGTLVSSGAGGEPLSLAKPLTPEGHTALGLLETELKEAGYPGGAGGFISDVAVSINRANAESGRTRPFPEVDIQAILAGFSNDPDYPRLRRLAVLLECSVNPCVPMPGARELVGSLAGAGMPLGLVSNAQFYTPLLLEALFGPAFCPTDSSGGISAGLSLFSYRLGFAKPDPAFFERAADLLAAIGIESRYALVVGNSAANDVAPARARGFMTALLARDARSFRPPAKAESAPEAMPDLVLKDLTDIERIAGL